MPTLKIGTRSFVVSQARVAREADAMFRRMSPAQRAHRVDAAKTALARKVGAREGAAGDQGGDIRRAVAILISQGIVEI